MYFDAHPDEPEATTYATFMFFGVAIAVAVIGLRAAKVVMLLVPVFLLGTALVLGIVQAKEVVSQPDLNGDGVFTIRDFLYGIALSVFAVGQAYGEVVFGTIDEQNRIVRFLEIPAWVLLWAVRIGCTAFVWFMAIRLIPVIIDYEQPKPDESE
jgi:hypothetical protein